jgi:hypothetical protein
MVGASAGDASGAGIRLGAADICGVGSKRLGLRAKPPPPAWPTPPRAKPAVDDPTTQATINIAANKRCMIAFLSLFDLPSR